MTSDSQAPTKGIGIGLANTDEGHDKQYRVYVFGKAVLTEWGGRLAKKTQNRVALCADVAGAKREFLKIVASKEKGGYHTEYAPRVVEIPPEAADLISKGAAPPHRFDEVLAKSTAVFA